MGLNLLVVDDCADDVMLLDRALKDADPSIQTFAVNNGVNAALYLKGEARFANRKKFPVPDLILLDLMMPLFDGFEFLSWLRNDSPENQRRIPVVVVSSAASEGDVRRVYELGANSFLVKPTQWSEYKRQICSVVANWANGTPSHPNVQRPSE
jgi:CheY-like chemotaxis protein